MTIPRIYLPRPVDVGEMSALREEDQKYIKSVLRLKKHDHLVVFDGCGHEYQAVIHQVQHDRTIVQILKKYHPQVRPVQITLAQAIPKAGKMDFIVQKATELGVDRIVPFQSVRSVSRLTSDQCVHKALRWRKVAIEASRQCGRADVPVIDACADFQEMLKSGSVGGERIIFWEEETRFGIRDVFRRARDTKEFFIVIGPEGGFSMEEIEWARQAGFQCASIGRQILRVETAVVAIMSIIQYERGMLGGSLDMEPGS